MLFVMRQERLRRGWTQEVAGKQVGLSKAGYSNIERGSSTPSYSISRKLLDLYGYSDPRVLFGEGPSEPDKTIGGKVKAVTIRRSALVHIRQAPPGDGEASLDLRIEDGVQTDAYLGKVKADFIDKVLVALRESVLE